MGETDQILMKVHLSYKPYLKKIHQYIAMTNEIIEHQNNYQFYTETIDDGYILIFKDLQAFHDFYAGAQMTIVSGSKEFIESIETKIKREFPEKKFPDEGFQIHLELINIEPSLVFEEIKEFYQSIHQDIEIIQDNDQIIIIKFPSYTAFLGHASFYFISDFL